MTGFLLMALFELGLPLLLALWGVYCIWRAMRDKPAAVEPGIGADGRQLSSDGETKKKKRRWLRVLPGLVLVTPAFLICCFFAYHLPDVIYLRRQYAALEKELEKPHWPRISIYEKEWYRVRKYWIAPWSELIASRSNFESYGPITNRALDGFSVDYFISLICTPGLHYGKYIRAQVPFQLAVVDREPATAQAIRLSTDQIALMFEPFAGYIRTLVFGVVRETGGEVQAFDGFSGLRSVIVNTNDLKVADWACRRPGLEFLYMNYSGPPSDAQGLAEGIAGSGQSLRELSLTLERAHAIDVSTFLKIYRLPKLTVLNLAGVQVDVTGLAEPLHLSLDNEPRSYIGLNLVGCSDEQLNSLTATNASLVRLDLNHSPVTDKGLGWLRRSGVNTLELSNAPGITFESAQLLPESLAYLHLRNVGLTDKGLLLLEQQNLIGIDIEQCPVSDPALIRFLKNSDRLAGIGLGDRKLSEELVRQITKIASIRSFEVAMESSGDQEMDLFLACAMQPTKLKMCVYADWDKQEADGYITKFKSAGVELRVIKPGSEDDFRRW